MMKKTKVAKVPRLIFIGVILLAGFALGLSCMGLPRPYEGKDPARFSATNAAVWIREIAKKPHSFFDPEAHDEVLRYLCNEFETMGVTPSLQEYTLNKNTLPEFTLKKNPLKKNFRSYLPTTFKLVNLQAKLEGKSDQAILLVSHYDSVYSQDPQGHLKGGVSYGAADAGYGLATILETVRVIKARRQPLENDLLILITDGEELEMLGAEQEVTQNISAFQNVKLVINLEARGIKGPAIMFETGRNQAAAMDFYFKHAQRPFSYSLATDIYRVMPNRTDFTLFIASGFSGYNFAVIDSLDYYHTQADNFKNINLASLQHYGEQIMPLVRDFVFTPSSKLPAFSSKTDAVFFNILPGVVFHYLQWWNWVMVAVIMMLALLLIFHPKIQIRFGRTLGMVGMIFSGLIILALFGTLVAYGTARLYKKPFMIMHLPNIPNAEWILAGVILAGAFVFVAAIRKFLRKNPAGMEAILGGVIGNIIFGVLCSIYLPGGAFLFLFPALLAALYSLVFASVKSRLLQALTFAVAAILILLFYVPLINMFYLALTFGAAGMIMVFVVIALSLLFPLCKHYYHSLSQNFGYQEQDSAAQTTRVP